MQELIAQLPVEQVAVALARLQVVPQAPQLVVVFRAVSQPLGSLPSQLPEPELQELIAQLPVEQVAVALVRLQVVPQVPQLVVVFREVSQPLLALLSQLP